MASQSTLFGGPAPEPEERTKREGNPMLAVYGPGPGSARCKTCAHLVRLRRGGTYRKCDLRRNTHGAATDHKATWPACGKYRAGKATEVWGP